MKKKILFSLSVFFSLSFGFAQIPSGYYANAAGKTGDVLRASLRDITTNGSTKLPYTSSSFDIWDAYAVTDVHPAPNNTKVWDMYSDVPGGTPAYTYTIYTGQCGTASAEGDCYAREHTMPNSWWGGLNDASNPQYTDLHHLFPADQYVNNRKSAHPLGQVSSPTWTSTNGSKIGPCSYPGYTGTVFEPIDGYKGDFARAYLYLATRYMNTIGSWVTNYPGTEAQYVIDPATNNYKTWFINMLIIWNNNDPVDQKEIDRNNAIYYNTPQHNRNPYIDHPEYVCLIWGASCTSAPVIANITSTPSYPTPAQTVTVSANITDNFGITSATCNWGTSPGSITNSINMSVTIAPGYATDAAIPAQIAGTIVYYKIVATDINSVQTISDVYSYCIRKLEPSNNPTAFSCGSIASSSITLTWTDATGAVIPDGYLIKASPSSYLGISSPVDGIPEINNNLVKSVTAGIGTCTFTALTSNNTYYFEIFPYTNFDSDINYKTDGTIATTSCTTTFASGTTTCINEGFDAGVTPPTGWTFTNIGGTYTGYGFYGIASPALKMDATGDMVQTATFGSATELSFHLTTAGVDPASVLKVEGYNGTGWSVIENITNWYPNSQYQFVYNSGSTPPLAPGFSQIRLTYTKVSGNLALDDVKVICQAVCNAPSLQASNLQFSSINSNDMIVRWTRGNGGSVVVAAKSMGAVNSTPVDGIAYVGDEVFGQGESLGAGAYVIYEGPATSVLVSGLTPSTCYSYAVFEYNTTEHCYDSPGATSGHCTLASSLPTLITSSISNIATTSGNSGGNITTDGGTSVTSRGVCWSTSASPTIANNKTTDGSGIGIFSSNITGLTIGTTYHVRAYATNTSGTTYGNEQVFTTCRNEPTNHATGLNCGTTGNTTIPLTWTDASTGIVPDGYLIKASNVSLADITDPIDYNAVADGLLTKNIAQGDQAWTFTGFTSNTTYYFKIYPYTNSGTNINYKTSAIVPNTSCSTSACTGAPVTIFSENIGTPAGTTTINTFETSNGFQNTSYTMTSGGATNPADVRITNSSSGYTNASGSGNIFFTSTNNNYGFAIEGIDASGFTSTNVQFAYRKESAAALPTLAFDYWNGTSYVNVPFSFNELATASTGWYLSPVISLPPAAQIAGLRLRWVKSGTTSVRIDDIKMTGIQILIPPTWYAVTGGGSFCTGGIGVVVGLDNSQSGINYQLKIGGSNIGSPVAGTGSAISFGNQTTPGVYTVVATNATTLCTNNMSGSVTVAVNDLPIAYFVTGGGLYCGSGIGLTVDLSNSEVGVNYQLNLDGLNSGSPVAGTGSSISFGDHTETGTYTVSANNAATGCTNNMAGNASISFCPITWTGASSVDWSDGTNWSTGSVPGLSNNVYIPSLSRLPHVTSSPVSPAECNNLTIFSGATLTIDAGKALTAYGNTTVQGSFIIESDINGTGSFIDNGIITGNVTVKKYLPDHRWWYIGSPLSNGTAAAFGSLSSSTSTGNRLFYWDEITHAYISITNTSTSMSALTGYPFKRYDSTFLTAVYTGSLNTGTIGGTSNLTYHSGVSDGYNLVSNPYPSAISLGTAAVHPGVTATNLVPTFWYRTNTTFVTYNWTTGIMSPIQSTTDIPAMQAFWVRTNGGTGGLQLTNEARKHSTQAFYKETPESNVFRIQLKNDSLTDETVVSFFSDASNDYDDFDSYKMFSDDENYPQIYTMTMDNTTVAINGQEEIISGSERIVPLGFLSSIAGTFTLQATNLNAFDPNISVYMEDAYLNYFQDMNICNTYTFTSGIVNNANRFKLHFGNLLTGISSSEIANTFIYTSGKSIYVNTSLVNGYLEIFDVLGKNLLYKNIDKGLSKVNVELAEGVYFVKVITGNNVKTQKIVIE